jgi:molybdopterin-guanine dinucleotide biosynthesis protein A
VDPSVTLAEARKHTPLFDEVLLCAPEIEPHLRTGVTLVADLFRGAGPLAGLHAALLTARHDTLLAVSGGQPLPPPETLLQLITHPSQGNAVVFEAAGQPVPFPGRYRRGCLRALRRALREGRVAVLPLLHELRCTRLPIDSERP